MTEPAQIRPLPDPQPLAPEAGPPAAAAPARRRKLDLSRIDPPENLEELRVEELSIDGICGVY